VNENRGVDRGGDNWLRRYIAASIARENKTVSSRNAALLKDKRIRDDEARSQFQ
jgi:hypothetical protein